MDLRESNSASNPAAAIAGVILAGGEGRRMGRVDKGQVHLAGRPLVAHVHARLRPQVADVIIAAGRNEAPYAPYGQVVSDSYPDFQGPLAGIEAAAAVSVRPYLLVVPCDQPCLPEDLAARLHGALQESGADVANVAIAGELHALPCLLRLAAARTIRPLLERGLRSVRGWQRGLRTVSVDYSAQAAAFCNVNTPDELAALQARQPGRGERGESRGR